MGTTCHLASDLHLEFLSDKTLKTLKKRINAGFYSNKTDSDILVLAGDITPDLKQYRTLLRHVAAEYNEVVAVAGNHEFYGRNFYKQTNELKTMFGARSNTHFLDCEAKKVLDVAFFGGTCWTDLNQNMSDVYYGMNDFVVIKGRHKPSENPYGRYSETWSIEEWREQHNKFRDTLAKHTEKLDIVVSHHLPDMTLISGKYKNNSLDAGYACADMRELINIPKCWMFGHTHSPSDTVMNGTRFLCNPVGYYNREISLYNEKLGVVI